MILNEKFNPYIKVIRIFFSENWGTSFIFKKEEERLLLVTFGPALQDFQIFKGLWQ